MERQPCPYRIYDDLGIGFTLGSVGGAVFHLIKGAKNAPRGERLSGAFAAIRQRAPVIGGNFAVWGGLFATFECLLGRIAGHTDSMSHAIASGALTGGVLAIRGGGGAIFRNALIGGTLLALIEGCSKLIQRYMAPKQEKQERLEPGRPEFGTPIYTEPFLEDEFAFEP
jgi:import inner membrane translocase subunit TIM17